MNDLTKRTWAEIRLPAIRHNYHAIRRTLPAGCRFLGVVKAADKLSAYIKCIEERKAGNNEFLSAELQTRKILEEGGMPEVQYFLKHFIPAFELNLDELGTIE